MEDPADPLDGDQLLKPIEARAILGISKALLKVWAREGRLKFISTPIRGDRRYFLSSVLKAKEEYPLYKNLPMRNLSSKEKD